MYVLLSGIMIFFGMHLVPSFVSVRRQLMDSLGEKSYLILYSVVSLLGLILIIYGKSQAAFQPVWNPPVWSRHIVQVSMLPAFMLFATGDMKSNIKRYTRHPMLWGVTLWSGAHLSANGDLASILLFGSFGIFSLFAILSANLRGAQKQTERYPVKKDVIATVAGLVAYGVIILLHPYLFGVAVI